MSDSQRGLNEATRRFLDYLQRSPTLRSIIKAPHDRTVAYGEEFHSRPAWQHLLQLALSTPGSNNFRMLPDVLRAIAAPQNIFKAVGLVASPEVKTLLDYANLLTGESGLLPQVPWCLDNFIIWRALSGIYIFNATGRVRLLVSDVPNKNIKVFYKTEMFVFARNPRIDSFSKEAIAKLRIEISMGTTADQIEMV